MKNFGIRLVAKYNNKNYHFATLKFKFNKELIYVFEFFDKRKMVNFHDFETGVEKTQRTVDHISFHRDGKVHLCYKNIKGKGRKMNEVKLKGNPFCIPNSQYAPLLVHSIYFDLLRMNIQKEISDIDSQDIFFEVFPSKKFSIVLFSLGAEVNYRSMLSSKQFNGVFNISKSRLVVEPFLEHSDVDIERISFGIFKDVNILLAYTEKVINVPDELIEHENKNNKEIGSISPFSIMPTEDKIRRLK
jgi:hypothetical protein